jgi:hypothetical protein
VIADSLPAHEQRSTAIDPAVCSLDDPAMGFSEDATEQRRLAASTDVREDATRSDSLFATAIVVAFVQAQVARSARPPRCAQHDPIESLSDHAHIMNVGCGRDRRDGNSIRVGQNVPFYPGFGSVCGIGPGTVPPFGALTIDASRLAHSKFTPCCFSYSCTTREKNAMKKPSRVHSANRRCRVDPAPKARGTLPLAARSQSVHDARQDSSIIPARSSAFRPSGPLRNQRLRDCPYFFRDVFKALPHEPIKTQRDSRV